MVNSFIFVPTEEQIKGRDDWVSERPDIVRKVAEKFLPWKLYLLTTTGQKVTVCVFDEEDDDTVTVRVNVLAEFNQPLSHERTVFGIDPNDLVETDVPSLEERVNNLLTCPLLSNERVSELIDDLKVLVRPDLWVLNDEGVAVRKS